MQRTHLALAGALALACLVAGGAWLATREDAPPRPPPAIAVAKVGKVLLTPSEANRAPDDPRALVKLGDVEVVQRQPPPTGPVPEGHSLLVVTWDTVRADHVSAYGYLRKTTPTFDALAAEGLLFERFLVPQATTLPTHVSLFTGTHPDEHGITGNAAHHDRFVPAEGLTPLAKHLSDAGYLTAGFVSSSPVKEFSGIAEGFQAWSQPKRRSRPGAETTGIAREWLETAPTDRPFFVWIHLYDPHSPYTVRAPYDEQLAEPPVQDWMRERDMLHEREHLSQRIIDALNAYDTELRYVDNQLEQILRALDARGSADSTVVVVAGDHGEGFGQHGHLEHGHVWEEQLASPLAIRAPGVPPERVATLTTAQDLLPILAGVGDFPDEAKLVEQASGRNTLADRNDRPVLSRMSVRQLVDLKGPGGSQILSYSLHTGDQQLIWRETGWHSLYDLRADPFAAHDIGKTHATRVKELAAQVEALKALHHKRSVELGAGKVEPLDPATIEELEALGYLE